MFRSLAFVCAAFVLSPLAAEGQVSIKRLGSADTGEAVDDVAEMVLRKGEGGDVITAVRTGGKLRLITWDVAAGGKKVTRLGQADDVVVDQIAAVTLPKPDAGHKGDVVTAVRTGGKLRLISWDIRDGGKTIERLGSADAGAVDQIAAVVLPQGAGKGDRDKVVTVVRTGGHVHVIVWNVMKDGKIERLGTGETGKVDPNRIAAVALPKPDPNHKGDVLIAVRTTGNKLRLISWDIRDGGRTVERLDTADAGTADHLTAVVLPKGAGRGDRDKVITAVRTDGHMHVIAWNVTKEGKIERLGTGEAPSVEDIGATVLRRGDKDVVLTAVRTGGILRLIAWHVADGGKRIERLDSADADKVDRIAAVSLPRGERGDVITAVRAGGKLRLIAWNVSGK